METIYFSAHINAPREKLWDIMLNKGTYEEWAKAFGEGSRYEGDWNEGSEIKFLAGDSGMGMASRIKESRRPKFVSIEHMGIVKDGIIDTTSDDAKKWAPSFENYTLTEVDGGTELSVSVDVPSEYKSMFEESWPVALQLLKEMAEK